MHVNPANGYRLFRCSNLQDFLKKIVTPEVFTAARTLRNRNASSHERQ